MGFLSVDRFDRFGLVESKLGHFRKSLKMKNARDRNKDWAILVALTVPNRANQVRYQRIVALAEAFNLIVITSSPLPEKLQDMVVETHIITNNFDAWRKTRDNVRQLLANDKKVYVHTQYVPITALTGYLSKRKFGCKWVYDLWDHPSLIVQSQRGPKKWGHSLLTAIVKRWVLPKADAWIIAMHPAVMGILPAAPVSCQLIFIRAGYTRIQTANDNAANAKKLAKRPLRMVYAGPIMVQRGMGQIIRWAAAYNGREVELNIIGSLETSESKAIAERFELSCKGNPHIILRLHGELSHDETQRIIGLSDIGLCPLDTAVLNYRFAFPIKVIEQMREGLIVVATKTHGTKALIKDGENGILAVNSADGMALGLDRAIGVCCTPQTHQEMRTAAIMAQEGCDWGTVNRQLQKELTLLLGSK